jgi:hypothetical protein
MQNFLKLYAWAVKWSDGSTARRVYLYRFLFVLTISLSSTSVANLPAGPWDISGDISDQRIESEQRTVNNTFTLSGHYDGGRFLVDMNPVKSEDEIAETAGWDGEFFYMIDRFPKFPGKGLPRDKALGYVEPSVFSRYATHALASVLLAFADDNQLSRLEKGQDLVILGDVRDYPEESNTYSVTHLSNGGVHIEALCPGLEVVATGAKVPIPEFPKGFTRWTYESNLTGFDQENNSGELSVQYRRFIPVRGKLVQKRAVSGKILFSRGEAVADFLPRITQDALTVLDYGNRPQLAPLYKTLGFADQNYMYKLTNHVWNFDRNVITAQFERRKAWLGSHKLTVAALDIHSDRLPVQRSHRTVIIICVVVLSLLMLWGLWLARKQISRNGIQ